MPITLQADYRRGYALGVTLTKARSDGHDPDIRWRLADEARNNPDGFSEFMRGLDAAMEETK